MMIVVVLVFVVVLVLYVVTVALLFCRKSLDTAMSLGIVWYLLFPWFHLLLFQPGLDWWLFTYVMSTLGAWASFIYRTDLELEEIER